MKEPRLALKITVKCEDEGYWSSYADPTYPINISEGYIYFTDIEESDEERHTHRSVNTNLEGDEYRIEIVRLYEESLCKY